MRSSLSWSCSGLKTVRWVTSLLMLRRHSILAVFFKLTANTAESGSTSVSKRQLDLERRIQKRKHESPTGQPEVFGNSKGVLNASLLPAFFLRLIASSRARRRHGSERVTLPSMWLHAHRTSRRDRDYRGVDRVAAPRRAVGSRGGEARSVHQQPQADRLGVSQLPFHLQLLLPRDV